MYWTRIRFHITLGNHYAEFWIGIQCGDFVQNALRVEAFCKGYEAASGFRAVPTQSSDFINDHAEKYAIHKDVAALSTKLRAMLTSVSTGPSGDS